MKNTVLSFSILASFAFLVSCKTNLKEVDMNSGEANLSRYVAIGNSLTAGYADGALYRNGQLNSYPSMLSQQFAIVGGGAFRIPLMDEGAGSDASGNPRRVLGYVIPCGSTMPTLSPVFDPLGSTAFTNVASSVPYNLIGVPGARAIDANFPLYSSLNPFLQRFCQTPGNSTMLSEALRVKPSFFTLWLGSNDVLLYAIGGAVPPTSIFSPTLTDSVSVRTALTQIVDTLVKGNAKGAIANVPDITSIPYFTTIPWNGAALTQGKADTLNQLYTSLGLTHITWKAGANGFVIVDSSAPGNRRHATANDFILLSTPGDSLRCALWGVSPQKPLADMYVLDAAEASTVKEHTMGYNNSIRDIALKYKLAHVDMYSYIKTLTSGIVYNGVSLNALFVSGGAFSLDGIHPNARGYALVANEFIRAINAQFKSSIPSVDVTKYQGVKFP